MTKTITLTDLQYDTLLVMLETATDEAVNEHSMAHSFGVSGEELAELEQIANEYGEVHALVIAQTVTA